MQKQQRSLPQQLEVVARLATILDITRPTFTKLHEQDEVKLGALWASQPSLQVHMVKKLADYIGKRRMLDPILMFDVLDFHNRNLVMTTCGSPDSLGFGDSITQIALDFYGSFVKGEGPIIAMAEAFPYLSLSNIMNSYRNGTVFKCQEEKSALDTSSVTCAAVSSLPSAPNTPSVSFAPDASSSVSCAPGASSSVPCESKDKVLVVTTAPDSFLHSFFPFFQCLSPADQTVLMLFYVNRAESLGYSLPKKA